MIESGRHGLLLAEIRVQMGFAGSPYDEKAEAGQEVQHIQNPPVELELGIRFRWIAIDPFLGPPRPWRQQASPDPDFPMLAGLDPRQVGSVRVGVQYRRELASPAEG